MQSLLRFVMLIALTSSGAALASDDCRRAMSEWQSREAVITYVLGLGLESERLRIDDGCYEVRARDSQGNQVRLQIDPTTLAILKLEVRFRSGNNASRYLQGSTVQLGNEIRPVEGPSGRSGK
jgi:hypothetical protein